MTVQTAKIVKTHIDATVWEPYPMPVETIVSGDPDAKVHWLRKGGPDEAPYFAGLWTAEPSVFDYRFEMNETAHVLEGHVLVAQEGGPTVELRPGDVVSFPRGAMTRWDVRQHLKKVFIDTP